MENIILTTNQKERQSAEVAANLNLSPLVKKTQIAMLLTCSPRQVDNYMARGMPHQKPSPRKVTFDSEEVLRWYKEQFGLQRRKSFSKN